MSEETNLAVLSTMLAPAVLISACGTLIRSTSNRLGRATDRVRRFADRLRALAPAAPDDDDAGLERQPILAPLPVAMRRAPDPSRPHRLLSGRGTLHPHQPRDRWQRHRGVG